MKYEKCGKCIKTIGWVGLVTNTVLTFLKAFVGLVSGSHALLADSLYSFKDVVSSLLVIVGGKVSEQSLDKEHPYGHGKIEFVLSLFVSVIFLIVTGFLLVYAVSMLFGDSTHQAPHLIALWTAILCAVVNVVMYAYSKCAATQSNSPLIKTLSQHHHADAISSSAVAVGIVGAHYLDMPWVDTLVAVVETLHLLYLGSHVFKDSVMGLMDRQIDMPKRKILQNLILGVEGVREIKHMRTRHIGQNISAEITVGVDENATVSEATAIANKVKETIIHTVSRIGAIQVKAEAHEKNANAAQDSDDAASLIEAPEGGLA
ncbi:Magnetosome protein MamM [Candidatus Terasakiella magnetica]|uniref:Magnetosome protein MamM n=1 Tax=Candidatus Terasakiella magnetica TaxID=1867952 RepID=A0A1C3RFQ1_9PROT|nr:magnetosome biogenesis CDF transporter MamM [Candidatus Terasakiella magnetica]SCA56089.1 Magnetosome protein MamM [Candidatus Terasakiella magnetica]